MSDNKGYSENIERIETTASQLDKDGLEQVQTMGTVKLTDGHIIYIPTPTADPQDPLNMKIWQKMAVTVLISIFSTLGLALVSGFGGLLGFYIEQYTEEGHGSYAEITHLLTYPSLFMGIGNLIGIPIVLLGSSLILILGAILSANAKTYNWHLGARMLLGLAAGQSEAVVPMIVQEIFYLHERSRGLMIQQTIQVILSTIWILFASPIAGNIGPDGWYYLGAGLVAAQFLICIPLLPETKYARSMGAFQEDTKTSGVEDIEHAKQKSVAQHATERPPLDFANFAPRTWKSDMRLWVGKPEWSKAGTILMQTFTVMLFPNVFWAMLLNGLTLGVNIAIGTTYGNIVTSPPYSWAQDSASYANCGQIVTALVALPTLGYGSDQFIKWMAKRHNGIHEPETRLMPLIFPIIVAIISAVLYGEAAQHPEDYHWFTIVFAIAGYYFGFVGAAMACMTYLLDSYPARAGPVLINICAFRGVISFGTSYAVQPFIDHNGYDGSFGVYAGLTGAVALLGVPIYFFGKNIRAATARFAKAEKTG